MEAAALAPTRLRKQNQTAATHGWTAEEDELLRKLMSESATVSWCAIAKFFPTKTAPQIAGRWDKVIDPRLVKGCWTREEDEAIVTFVNEHGDKDWAKLALLLEGRTGKQCRERYRNHLNTAISHCPWTLEEDGLLAQLHERYGNSWTRLAPFFQGRTDNCIKNRWNSTVKKRLDRIEKGQPLVQKRGRKPKARIEKSETSTTPPSLSIPLNPLLRTECGLPPPSFDIAPLEHCRRDLQRLLCSFPA
jgi:hypothetical protein